MSVRLVHDGDGGDCIAALPILRQLGGGQLVLTQGKNPRPFRGWYDLLKPLCEAQPYVDSVVWEDNPGPADHHIQEWRKAFYNPAQTLAHSMADALGVKDLDLSPWLTVSPSAHSAGRVIMHRSKRYRNPNWPLRKIVAHYGARLLLVGLVDERRDFEARGYRLEHYKVANFLDLAQLIAGSSLFIGNQSSPCWVAMGLGHPGIQEVSAANNKDSMVPRDNFYYYQSGDCPLYL